jgi:hypothetical protein
MTPDQARALSDYIRWAGPEWQTKLRRDWMRGGSEWPGEWAYLQQLRNTLGNTMAAAQELVDQEPEVAAALGWDGSKWVGA